MTFIFGIGGNSTAIYSLMIDLGMKVSGFIVDEIHVPEFHNHKIYSTQDILAKDERIACVVSVGENFAREKIVQKFESTLGDRIVFPNLIHPTAYVSRLASLGKGNVLFPGAKIGANSRIRNFVHLNTNSSVDHDTQISSFCSLAPGAILGGNIKIGERTSILLNSAVSNGITIANDVVIGAMSFLKSDVDALEIWAGTPAVFKRKRSHSESYL